MIGFYEPYWDQPNELEHFGVKGMKWGVRRYQNADGSLTEAGKKKRAKMTKKFQKLDSKSEKAKEEHGEIVKKSVVSLLMEDYKLNAYWNREAKRKYAQRIALYEDGVRHVRKMQKNFGKVAFDDMDSEARKSAEAYSTYGFPLLKRIPGTYSIADIERRRKAYDKSKNEI